MKKAPASGRFWRIGLSVFVIALVFISVQTVQPLVNNENTTSTASDEQVWTGALPAFAQQAVDGKKIYMTRCMSCHQANGQGVSGVFPPLANTEYVSGDAGRLVRIILHGLTGEIEVNGVKYSGAMPPWGTFLKDEEVAALSTYIRSNFGNKASAVTAEQVAKVRAATADRKQPWTAAELQDKANQGVPDAK